MSNNKYVNGWLLPKGINVEPTPVLVPDDAAGIATIIGCDYVDVIYNIVGDDEHRVTQICGYVDDEGLMKPHDLEDVNHLAMFLLDYSQPIIGDVVIVGAGTGNGYDTDLPEWLTDMKDDVTATAADKYNQSMGMTLTILQAVEDGIISFEEMNEAIQLNEPDEKFAEICRIAVNYNEAKQEGGLSIVDGLDKMLEEES